MNKAITKTAVLTISSIILIGCGGGEDTSTYSIESYPFNAPLISEADKSAYLNAVNTVRATGRSCGSQGYFEAVAPLQWHDGLYKSAYEHSQDMASTGIMQHNGSNTATDWTSNVLSLGRGSTAGNRIGNNVGLLTKTSSENVGTGTRSLEVMMNGWLGSSGHCSGLMNGDMEFLGMAEVNGFWTQNFMKLKQ